MIRWRQRGSGWHMDSWWLAAICYADDVLLVSSTKDDLINVLEELVAAFAHVGLSVGMQKTHWSSYPPEPNGTLNALGHTLSWEPTLLFVGHILDLVGRSHAAVDHRMAQATKALGRWKPILRSKLVTPFRKIWLVSTAVFSSFLWLAETWHPTTATISHYQSWGARTLARAYGCRRRHDDSGVDFWTRLHRLGHRLYNTVQSTLDQRRRINLHRWAGHLARSENPILKLSLRTRCLSWWRFSQLPHVPLHGRRFGKPWRWEAQLEAHYGEASCDNPEAIDCGWMATAADRCTWKAKEAAFAKG